MLAWAGAVFDSAAVAAVVVVVVAGQDGGEVLVPSLGSATSLATG